TEMRKGPRGEAVAELPLPTGPAPKPPVAWRARWKKPSVYVRYHGVDPQLAIGVADRVAKHQCDVTYLGNDAGENLHDAYLKHSDAEILFFGCQAMDWARMDALHARDIASDQGRPKRLGVLTDRQCSDGLGMISDFIVPLRLTDAGE